MKHKIATFIIIITTTLFLVSCSSEEEIDFTGEYRTTLLEFFDCVDPSGDGRSFTANASNNFCQTVGDIEDCFRIIITINIDGTFEYVYSENTIRGMVSVGGPVETLTGSYTTDGPDIEMCPSDRSVCFLMTIDGARQNLEWLNADPNCTAAYTLSKS